MEIEAPPSETWLAAVDRDACEGRAGSPSHKDAMDVDANENDAMDADQKDVLCTVCALTLPPCLPCLPHPRLEGKIDVACCGVCADELEQADEDDEEDDACAWCDDGGELLVCDGCERAKTTGCGLPAGPFGAVGAIEGVSYLAVIGIAGASLATKAKTGSGLKAGPGGLLGLAEGLAFTAIVVGLVVLAFQFADYGYLPNAIPVEGGRCD